MKENEETENGESNKLKRLVWKWLIIEILIDLILFLAGVCYAVWNWIG